MAVVLEDPEVAPGVSSQPPRRWRAVALVLAVLAVTSAVVGKAWYERHIDPFKRPGSGSGQGVVPVRTGTVQGFMVAYVEAEKHGTLRGFAVGGVPAGTELVGTQVYFLGEEGGPAAPFPYGCRPTGLNAYFSSDGRGVSGRFEEVDEADFRAGDILQLIAYVRFDEPGPFEIPASVAVRYAVGPLTKTTTVPRSTTTGLVADDANPAGVPRGPDCRVPDDTRGGT